MSRRGALEEEALAFIRRERLLAPGDTVTCAVSGGADSMALLWFLHTYRDALGIDLEAAHVHHQIPEARSDEASAAVRAAAERLGVRCRLCTADVPGLARRRGVSLEAAGRRVRHGWFRKLANRSPRHRVATAHTADDQAETVLLRVLRGAGLRGLGGIRPGLILAPHPTAEGVPPWSVVRPFLGLRRALTRAFCVEHGIAVIEDPTNQDVAFTRNRVRQELLPLLQERFNPAVVDALCRLARAAARDEAWLEAQAEIVFHSVAGEEGDGWHVRAGLQKLDPALRIRIWSRVLRAAGLADDRLDALHLDRLDDLLGGEPGRALPLPGGGRAQRIYQGVRLVGGRAPLAVPAEPPTVPLRVPGTTEDVSRGLYVRVESEDTGDRRQFSEHGGPSPWSWRARLDGRRIQAAGPLALRARRPGDRWMPPGHAGLQKLKVALNAWRIPPEERHGLALLTAGDEIAAVVGRAVDARFATGPESSEVLVVEVTPRPVAE